MRLKQCAMWCVIAVTLLSSIRGLGLLLCRRWNAAQLVVVNLQLGYDLLVLLLHIVLPLVVTRSPLVIHVCLGLSELQNVGKLSISPKGNLLSQSYHREKV